MEVGKHEAVVAHAHEQNMARRTPRTHHQARRRGHPLALAILPTWLGPFGLLPLVVPFALVVALRLGVRIAPDRGRLERGLCGALALIVIFAEGMRIAAGLGVVSLVVPLALLALGWLLGTRARPPGVALAWSVALPSVVVAVLALFVAVVTAYYVPIWQWDSLGYHLPFVNYVLQAHGLSGVPDDVPYLATYPHGVELLFVALRSFLPDDRLVDLGQIPFGLLGAVATAAIARRAGATLGLGLAVGAYWLCMPSVLLQLPTNYVDVAASAYFLIAIYFLTGEPTERDQWLAGLALGLFLGAKPSAPLPTVLAGAVLLWRGRRAPLRMATLAAAALVLALGAEAYVTNIVRHHNPIWPVAMHLGPISLPGPYTLKELLSSGAAAPHLTGPLPLRVVRSWLTMFPPPFFDMRMGGFGPAFVIALPLALIGLWHKRNSAWPLLALAALAAPDPAIARYTLAFPAVVLALGAGCLGVELRRQRAASFALAAFAAFDLVVAFPGFAGEGPALYRYAAMTPGQRTVAVGPDRQTKDLVRVRDALPAGGTIAYDRSFEFAYLLWRPDLQNRVVRIPDDADAAMLAATLDHEPISIVVAADPGPTAWALAHGFQPLFHCETDTCTVYQRR